MRLSWSKRVLFVASLATLLLLCGSVLAQSLHGLYKGHAVVKLRIDGRDLSGDVPPIIMDGRTLVPARLVAEALGATVSWDPATYTVTIASKDKAQGTREGFHMTDRSLGILAATVAMSDTAQGHVPRHGHKVMSVMLVLKNFSQTDFWVAPDTFWVVSGDRRFEHIAATYSNTAKFVAKLLKPGEYTTGLLMFEVPANATYHLVPGHMLYSTEQPKVPLVPNN